MTLIEDIERRFRDRPVRLDGRLRLLSTEVRIADVDEPASPLQDIRDTEDRIALARQLEGLFELALAAVVKRLEKMETDRRWRVE